MTQMTTRFNKYVEVEVKGKKYLMNEKLVGNLDNASKSLFANYDLLFIVDGKEGVGKSTFVQQCAYYMSRGKFSCDNICFDGEDFLNKVNKQINNKVIGAHIVIDEGFNGLSSRGTMSDINKRVVSTLQQMRQLNMVIWVCIPSVWDLDKYVVCHRTRGLFHCYTHPHDRTQRGYFEYYDGEEFAIFYNNSRKRYVYPKGDTSVKFYGKWNGYSPMDDLDKYIEMKSQAMRDITTVRMRGDSKEVNRVNALLYILYTHYERNYTQIERYFKQYCSEGLEKTQIRERIGLFARTIQELGGVGEDLTVLNSAKRGAAPPIPNGSELIE